MTTGTCIVTSCNALPSKAGFDFCYPHWKAQRNGKIRECGKCHAWHEGDLCPDCDENPRVMHGPAQLSSTKLGQQFDFSARRANLILAELGWIEKYVKGWTPTEPGNRLGAELRTSSKGVPYVIWPTKILEHKALLDAVGELKGSDESNPSVEPSAQTIESVEIGETDAFRRKYPPQYRTQDGHMVRSRAEVMIDDYLYQNRIVHAYERRLPIEEDLLCDFYLPENKVYIEFWGMESNPQYRQRKETKLAIYANYGFQLVELTDADVQSLDDTLPRKLIGFGVDCG